MRIHITGDERDVANSAWVSTINEISAKNKSHDKVMEVVKFLVENHHTSPFECATLTFEIESQPEGESVYQYVNSNFCRVKVSENTNLISKFTIDLLNFVKVTSQNSLWDGMCWQLFKSSRPFLAEELTKFSHIQDTSLPDVSDILGEHGMAVELIHLHDEVDLNHSRATWRVKAPLAITVQMLRHRTGSFNQTSGRYRTIIQKLVPVAKDVSGICTKANVDIDDLFNTVSDVTIKNYQKLMSDLKASKESGLISNTEYKRARECARFVLPEGRLTELYVTFYLSDFYENYYKLRNSSHAQTEHIWVAQQMEKVLNRM